MSNVHATLFAAWVGTTLFMSTPFVAAVGASAERPLTLVVLDDGSGARDADIAAAQSVAARLFARIGTKVVWRTRQEFGADMPAAPAAARAYCQSVVFVHLTATLPRNPTVLGKALTDSNVVWAYVPRIEEAATGAAEPLSEFLGYVIAHEIGHILLGTHAHTPFGIMAERINVDAVRRRTLGFLPDQAARMQKKLTALAALEVSGHHESLTRQRAVDTISTFQGPS